MEIDHEFFKTLDVGQRLVAVKEFGKLLGTKVHGGEKILVYSLSNFFVELYFEEEMSDLRRIVSFTDGKQLDKYSDLDGLME